MNEPARVLIIDDDKSLLLGLAETIKREGTYQVLAADNGKLGIQLAEESLPHLIVCDLMMPPPDGLAVLKALSTNPATATIPFIFLTARTDVITSQNHSAKMNYSGASAPFCAAKELPRLTNTSKARMKSAC